MSKQIRVSTWGVLFSESEGREKESGEASSLDLDSSEQGDRAMGGDLCCVTDGVLGLADAGQAR